MAIKMRNCNDISGFKIKEMECKVTQCADDITITVNNLDSVVHVLDIIAEFGTVSGLVLNKDKCDGILLGALKDSIKDYTV